MTSRGSGTSFSRKNYRLSTEPEKSKVAGRNVIQFAGEGLGGTVFRKSFDEV